MQAVHQPVPLAASASPAKLASFLEGFVHPFAFRLLSPKVLENEEKADQVRSLFNMKKRLALFV